LVIHNKKGDNKVYKAYHILKEPNSVQNRYKFALVCLKLQKFPEAEKALVLRPGEDEVPGGAAGYYLLGTICEKQARQKEALGYFMKAMELDPTLWVAFEKICRLSPNINPISLFPENHPLLTKFTNSIQSKDYFNNTDQPLPTFSLDLSPFDKSADKKEWSLEKTPLQKTEHHLPSSSQLGKNTHSVQQNMQPTTVMVDISPTPPTENRRSNPKIIIQTPQNPGMGSTPGIPKKIIAKGLQAPQKVKMQIGANTSSSCSMKSIIGSEEVKSYGIPSEHVINPFVIPGGPIQPSTEFEISPIPMQSLGNSENIPQTLSKSTAQKPLISSPSPVGIMNTQQISAISTNTAKNTTQIKDIISLIRMLANAYFALATYKCTDAINLFKKLPKNQYSTGWVQTQIGRALFETIRYSEAEKIYAEALVLEPYRLEGLEYYSTCLWHLKKQVDLCKLSNYALEMSLYAPETWCVVGNCFSLQKEHETALKFFSRAVQLNPYFAYAHTLCGHEYVSNEDFEQARKSYQRAINVDDRHYNAWWGMGNICLKQERYDFAIQYLKSAIKINPKSSVLSTYLGMTFFHNKQAREALECFDMAEKMDPNNPLNRYQKATVLMSLNQYDKALTVLEELNVRVPKEAPIHILIGKIYKKLGNKDKALSHYNIAMDLDPKEARVVKVLIDKLDHENDTNEENEI